MRVAFGLAAGALLLASSATTFAQGPGASVDLKTPSGQMVGTATFTQMSDGVHLQGKFMGLPPGQHGIHVHAVGKCDAPDFMTAGGHFNPTSKMHGLHNPQGAHAGDMPNLTIAADGTGTIDAMLKDASLASGAGSLFGPDGTALVVHATADDEMTDPSGNSGGRIACGVINRVGTTTQAAPAAQPSPAAKPAAAPAAAPATQPAPAAKPAAPAQAPAPAAAPAQAPAKPAAVASPAALPRTGSASLPFDASLPAALTGLGAMAAGLMLWRRRK